MEQEKKGNVHQEPRKEGIRPNEKNVNPEQHKKGHEKGHEHTERKPK